MIDLSRFHSRDLIALSESLINLEWYPSLHHRLVNMRGISKYRAFKRRVLVMFMIRHLSESSMVWLANELMFEICKCLFVLDHHQ